MALASELQTLAINGQDIADTAAIDISPFKTDVLKPPKTTFRPNSFIGGNNSRARCFQFACFHTPGCVPVVKMIQLRLWSSFFHEHGSSSGAHGFHVCGSCSGAVAILE